MPIIYKKLQYHSQMGQNTANENFVAGGSTIALNANRVAIFRFSYVEIPKGSTINSATLHLTYSHKTAGTTTSFSQNLYVDGVTPSQWLDHQGRAEWNGANVIPHRSYVGGVSQNVSFTQTEAIPRTIVSQSVKTHLDTIIGSSSWTLAGGSVTFLVGWSSITEPDYTYLHGPADGWSPLLVIDYTPPASDGKATVVNIQENANFARITNAAGAIDYAPYGFNAWFGAFVAPNVSAHTTLNSEVTVAPPSGGNMLRLAASTGRFMYHFGVPRCEEGKWYNFSCYTWKPSSSPTNMSATLDLLGDSISSGERTESNQWIRHDKAFMMDDAGPWACVEAGGSGFTWDSNAVLYLAGVQLTEGRMPRPWIGGNKTLAGADYGWAGVAGTNGFVRAVPPVASVGSSNTADRGRRKYFPVNWSYSQTSGHGQNSAMVKIKKEG